MRIIFCRHILDYPEFFNMNTGGGVELKRKSIVVFVAFLAMCLVLYWLWHSRGSSTADSGTGAEAKEPQRDTKSDAAPGDVCQWKGQNCLPVPEFLSNTRPRIDEKTVDILYETQKLVITYRQSTPKEGVEIKKPTVVLLHGMAYSSDNWQRIRTLHFIAAMGHYAYAVDLPGFGTSTHTTVNDKGGFIAKFLKTMNIEKPIIISPSMSGSFSLPYLFEDKDGQTGCESRASGFIPVAPAGTNKFVDARYHECKIPTMIVYGSKDTGIGAVSLKSLRHMPNSDIMPMEGHGHPCYIEDPDEWHRLLYNYLLTVETS